MKCLTKQRFLENYWKLLNLKKKGRLKVISMPKLLILGPSYMRKINPNLLPAIERYDGIYYRIVRKYMDKIKKKRIDIIIITEDLELLQSNSLLPYKSPKGKDWRSLALPKELIEKKQKEIRRKLLRLIESKHYDEIFIVLNKHYKKILPDLTPYTSRVISDFRGLGHKAQALKEWIEQSGNI